MKVLKIDASARRDGSITREWTEAIASRLAQGLEGVEIVHRDLEGGLPLLNDELVTAIQTPDEEQTEEQRTLLSLSNELIDELTQADVIVLGTPVYNFGGPASLKAYIDLVARARKTFRYSEAGPVGLLKDRPVYVVVASGGTKLFSDIDFLGPHLNHVLGFLGLHDVRFVDLSRLMFEAEAQQQAAQQQVDLWLTKDIQHFQKATKQAA
ncbi:MAG: FMN-dependent NADH-azoreductase [Deltaproteobacteria bacterium]|nr:MAG: FMN-dependent NADH-azoreductase [Deltaproteobacteria bacterium]